MNVLMSILMVWIWVVSGIALENSGVEIKAVYGFVGLLCGMVIGIAIMDEVNK